MLRLPNGSFSTQRIRPLPLVTRIAAGMLASIAILPGAAFAQDAEQTQAFADFTAALSNAKLAGRFSVLGQDPSEDAEDEYHIESVAKLEEGDLWLFKTRIKYGSKDLTVPLPLNVRWAGSTPVITVDELDIPLIGRVSARVVIDGDRYAGTWSHGDVRGHLWGTIQTGKAEPAADGKTPDSEKP